MVGLIKVLSMFTDLPTPASVAPEIFMMFYLPNSDRSQLAGIWPNLLNECTMNTNESNS